MRPASLTPLAVLALALAACSEGETPPPQPEPEPTIQLGDVDLNEPLRVLGTEPFWSVAIDAQGLVYDGVDRPEQRADNAGPQVQGATAVWTARTDADQTLTVTLIDTECSDGMSDRVYPLTARVQIADETLNGCAATVRFLETTDEKGQARA